MLGIADGPAVNLLDEAALHRGSKQVRCPLPLTFPVVTSPPRRSEGPSALPGTNQCCPGAPQLKGFRARLCLKSSAQRSGRDSDSQRLVLRRPKKRKRLGSAKHAKLTHSEQLSFIIYMCSVPGSTRSHTLHTAVSSEFRASSQAQCRNGEERLGARGNKVKIDQRRCLWKPPTTRCHLASQLTPSRAISLLSPSSAVCPGSSVVLSSFRKRCIRHLDDRACVAFEAC